MGLIRFELMTPSLSEKCSNQLSYGPDKKNRNGKEEQPMYFYIVKSLNANTFECCTYTLDWFSFSYN